MTTLSSAELRKASTTGFTQTKSGKRALPIGDAFGLTSVQEFTMSKSKDQEEWDKAHATVHEDEAAREHGIEQNERQHREEVARRRANENQHEEHGTVNLYDA